MGDSIGMGMRFGSRILTAGGANLPERGMAALPDPADLLPDPLTAPASPRIGIPRWLMPG